MRRGGVLLCCFGLRRMILAFVQVIMEDAAFACCTLQTHRFPLYRLL